MFTFAFASFAISTFVIIKEMPSGLILILPHLKYTITPIEFTFSRKIECEDCQQTCICTSQLATVKIFIYVEL